MELVITINLDNAAFCDTPGEEISRILQEYCKDIEENPEIKGLFQRFNDFNGNRVGRAEVLIEPDLKYTPGQGQDRESYSDSQDRENYVIDDNLDARR